MRNSWRELIDKFNKEAKESIPGILETIDDKRFILKDNLLIFPTNENIFKCFNYSEISEITVVIIGQDPYHGPDQATGLAFATPLDAKIPPSLNNIMNELKDDLDIDLDNTSLEHWARQGVLLLNASLTVIQGAPASQIVLWSKFTDYVIKRLNNRLGDEPIIFVAWGAFAHNKLKEIDLNKHEIHVSSHPSPLSCYKKYKEYPAFKGSKPFSKINQLLAKHDTGSINW